LRTYSSGWKIAEQFRGRRRADDHDAALDPCRIAQRPGGEELALAEQPLEIVDMATLHYRDRFLVVRCRLARLEEDEPMAKSISVGGISGDFSSMLAVPILIA